MPREPSPPQDPADEPWPSPSSTGPIAPTPTSSASCPDMHLAHRENEVAVGAVLDRLPDPRLDPEAEDLNVTGRGFRAPRSLPVRFG